MFNDEQLCSKLRGVKWHNTLHLYPLTSGELTTKKNLNDYLIWDNKIKKMLFSNYDLAKLLMFCDGLNSTKEIIKKICKGNKKQNYIKKQIAQSLQKLYEDKIIVFQKNPNKVPIRIRTNNLKYPLNMAYLELTQNCNFSCIHCYLNAPDFTKRRRITELTTKQYFKIIDLLDGLGVISIIVTGGEPFLRKDIFDILNYINSKHISLSILTNGSLLKDKDIQQLKMLGLKKIAISLDSHLEKTFKKIRNPTTYKKVVTNIRKIIAYKIPLEINAVLFKNLNNSYNHLTNFFVFLKKLGLKRKNITCDIFMPVGAGKNKRYLKLDEIGTLNNLDLAYRRVFHRSYIQKQKESINNKTYNSFCGVGREMIYIGSEGNIFLCPGLRNDDLLLGNIFKDNFKGIWANPSLFKYFRNKTYLEDSECKSCRFVKLCDGGCKARAMHFYGKLNSKDSWMCAYYERNKR